MYLGMHITQLPESMTRVASDSLMGRAKRIVTGFDGVVDVAMERLEEFLGQQKTTNAQSNGPTS
jgi:hypothetical protein